MIRTTDLIKFNEKLVKRFNLKLIKIINCKQTVSRIKLLITLKSVNSVGEFAFKSSKYCQLLKYAKEQKL